MDIILLYYNSPAMLVDLARCPADGGAIGSNWLYEGQYNEEAWNECEEWLKGKLSQGYSRGRTHNPQF